MGAGDHVFGAQGRAGPYRGGLLPYTRVNKAGDQSGPPLVDGSQFKFADEEHTMEKIE
jgi:hypothetical protein